jgi:Putative zinc-finger
MAGCRELLEELGNYLDDDVSAELRRDLEVHLADCSDCKIIADSAKQTVKIVAGCRSFELPPKSSARIMARIKSSDKRKS